MSGKKFDDIIKNFISSGDSKIDSLLKFTAEIDEMPHILRRTMLVDSSRRENDAEHSWHIAVMAMLFQDYATEKIDTGRVAKMCVVHDLVEIYAGDTFAFDIEGNSSKEQREKEAADRLFSHLPEETGKEIRALWEEFDAMSTADSRYANCMDRIQPFLHNTLTDGHTWVLGQVKMDAVIKRMQPVKNFMPALWPWVENNLDRGIEQGWILK